MSTDARAETEIAEERAAFERDEARAQGGYVNSPACKLLATNCVFCGRPLVDAESVERGAGPECAPRYLDPIKDADRKEVNRLVYNAALAAQGGKVEAVLDIAGMIEESGYPELAAKIRERFTTAVEGSPANVKIVIEQDGDTLKVITPFRRAAKEDFIAAWRAIPGRRYDRAGNCNVIPVTQKRALWNLLQTYFHGVYGKGPQGLFRVV